MKLDDILKVRLEDLTEGQLMFLLDAVSDEVKRKYLPKPATNLSVEKVKEIFSKAFTPVSTDLKDPRGPGT